MYELKRFPENALTLLFLGGLLSGIFLSSSMLVSQFAQVFPGGIYSYAATAFISGVILVWAVMVVKPAMAIFLLLAILPLGARLSEFFKVEIGDLIVTADVIAIWVAALIYAFVRGLRRDRFFLYFALFILVAVISSLVNLDSKATSIILCGIITPFLAYGLIVSETKDMQGARIIVCALGFIVVFCALFAFTQPFINKTAADFIYLRLSSVFYNPIIFADVIILLWPFTLIYEPFGSNRLPKLTFVFRLIGVSASLVALVLAESRGADVICGLQILWLLSKFKVSNQHNAHRMRYAFLLIIFVALGAAIYNADFLFETVFRRFTHIDFSASGNSASERVLGVWGALELGFGNPILGVGLGGFKDAYLTTSAASVGMFGLESAHNFILNQFAEVGTLGLASWLLIVASANSRLGAAKDWLYSKHESALHAVVQTSFVGYTATHFLFYGEFLHKSVGLPMILYFVVIGLISSLYFMQRNRSNSA